MTEEKWVKYKGRESIVEIFEQHGVKFVHELWPAHEPKEHATFWDEAGYEILDREVFWTDENPALIEESQE